MNFNDKFKLVNATIDVNDFCNMKCSYCWEQQNKNRLSKEKADIICDRLISNFKENKPASNIRVHFFGGEPLIDWDVVKYVIEKISSSIPSWFGITTNATIITDEMIDFFVQHNVSVMVSIDGEKERHDSNRKFLDGRGTYDIVIKNFQKIIDAGIDCEARMTIIPKNAKYIYEDVKHLVDLGVKHIAPCPVYDQKWSEEELDEFGSAMIKLYDVYIDKHFSQDTKVYIKFFEDYLFKDLNVNHKNVPCGFGSNAAVSIDTEGNVYPCHQVPTRADKEKFKIANIISGEVYNNEFVKPICSESFYSEKCKICVAYKTICGGGCPMESYQENKDLLSPTCTTCDFYRLYYKTILELQERGIPSPLSPSERRDFLYSSIMRMLGNIRNIIDENRGKEFDIETISMLSQAMWLINEQILNNKNINLNTFDVVNEIKEVSELIKSEVK